MRKTWMNHSYRFTLFLTLLLPLLICAEFVACADAIAAHYKIYPHANRPQNSLSYDQIMAQIGPGDSIEFPNGKSFTLGSSVKSFSSEKVRKSFLLATNPKLKIDLSASEKHLPLIWDQIQETRELIANGLPIVQLTDDLKQSYYIVTEAFSEGSISFNDFLLRSDISLETKKLMMDELELFSSKTAVYAHLGDFDLEKLVFDPSQKKWLLASWSSDHVFVINQIQGFYQVHPKLRNDTIWSDYWRSLENMLQRHHLWKPNGIDSIGFEKMSKIVSLLKHLGQHIFDARNHFLLDHTAHYHNCDLLMESLYPVPKLQKWSKNPKNLDLW